MHGNAEVIGAAAWAHEISSGKDICPVTGMPGVSVLFEWGYFSIGENSFLEPLILNANLPGHPHRHSSGKAVILINGRRRHENTADRSPLTPRSQIACHEETSVWTRHPGEIAAKLTRRLCYRSHCAGNFQRIGAPS